MWGCQCQALEGGCRKAEEGASERGGFPLHWHQLPCSMLAQRRSNRWVKRRAACMDTVCMYTARMYLLFASSFPQLILSSCTRPVTLSVLWFTLT